jgi:hypothetical protein
LDFVIFGIMELRCNVLGYVLGLGEFEMTNKEYRESRGTQNPCTALVLPTGNYLAKNRVIDADELIFVDDTICKYCGFTDEKQICGYCGREKE